MAILKYKDPVTGEIKKVGAPIGECGVDIPASDTAPSEGEWWLDTSGEDVPAMGGTGGVYVQAEEPENAPDNAIWIDTDEEGAAAVAGMQMELLWENASPTSEFAEQTINLDLSEYDMVYIRLIYETTYSRTYGAFIFVGDSHTIESMNHPGSTAENRVWKGRLVEVNKTGIYFTYGVSRTETTITQSNIVAIPTAIYGIKGVQS